VPGLQCGGPDWDPYGRVWRISIRLRSNRQGSFQGKGGRSDAIARTHRRKLEVRDLGTVCASTTTDIDLTVMFIPANSHTSLLEWTKDRGPRKSAAGRSESPTMELRRGPGHLSASFYLQKLMA
jgi:hypothetical protein